MKLVQTLDGDIEAWADNNDVYWKVSKQKVWGGWIVYRDQKVCLDNGDIQSMTSTAVFVKDPNHLWDGDYFVK